MPAHIILVHDDTDFLERAAAALRTSGHRVVCCAGSMAALSELDGAGSVDLLITRATFCPGTPNGVALARMARRKKRGIAVLFVAQEGMREYTDGTGDFMPAPVGIPDLLDRVCRLLAPVPQPPAAA